MSLLQEHANQLGNHITNNEELQNVAASQKAQSLADKYNEIQEHYNAGVGAISTLSSAFHMGRKVYKGLQKARAGTSVEPPTASTTQATPNAPTDGEAVDPAARPPGAPKPKKMNVPTDVEDTRATSAATFQERATSDPVAQGANLTEEQLKDIPLNQVQPDGSIKATGPTPRELETQTGARPAQASSGNGTQAEAPAGENSSAPMTDADRLGAPRAGEPVNSSSGGQLSVRSAEGGVEGAEGLGGDLTENIGSQVAKKGLGTAIKSAIGGIGSEGLEAGAMTALDAVPVVGELAAVGMGLYSLFHGLGDKPPDAATEKAKAPTGAEGAAIDPSALLGKAN
jgi:hypothetical protein